MDHDTFVIVTAYNEAELIGATLDALARAFPAAHVLLADDGSTDATVSVATERGVHAVGTGRMLGKGEAATLAAREALSNAKALADAERRAVFVLCDGDLGASAGELATLARAVADGEADVAVAAFSKRVGGGFGFALGFARWAIRRRCGLRTGAPISGQRALSEQALIDVLPFAHGFGMEVGMTIDAVRAGHRVVEIELNLAHRASGRTIAGFLHRGRQLIEFARVYVSRGPLGGRDGRGGARRASRSGDRRARP
jgi:glycosyltransferase involved in cell wall biosynthesis